MEIRAVNVAFGRVFQSKSVPRSLASVFPARNALTRFQSWHTIPMHREAYAHLTRARIKRRKARVYTKPRTTLRSRALETKMRLSARIPQRGWSGGRKERIGPFDGTTRAWQLRSFFPESFHSRFFPFLPLLGARVLPG